MLGSEDLNVGPHVVQPYSHARELAGRVTGYLPGAVKDKGVAVVIGTNSAAGIPSRCRAASGPAR